MLKNSTRAAGCLGNPVINSPLWSQFRLTQTGFLSAALLRTYVCVTLLRQVLEDKFGNSGSQGSDLELGIFVSQIDKSINYIKNNTVYLSTIFVYLWLFLRGYLLPKAMAEIKRKKVAKFPKAGNGIFSRGDSFSR